MSGTRTALENKVREIVMNTLGLDENECTNEASLRNDLAADSLDAVEIIMNIEREFNINISDQDADGLDSIGKIAAYLESKNVKF